MRVIVTDGRLRVRRTATQGSTPMSRGGRFSIAAALATLALLAAPTLALGTTPAPTPTSTSAPTLSGVPAPGQTLTCSTGAWSGNPSGFSYAWLRDGAPIAGQSGSAYVVQSADQGHSISCQVTASNGGGEYTIVGLPSGSYKVEFFPSEGNYLFQYFNGQSSPTTATPVAVTAPNTTSDVNAELHVGGQITGKVTVAAGGAALAEVLVCTFDESSGGGGCATANGGGEYTIVGLPTGSYRVWFYPTGGNYLPQPYVANPVPVTAGSTTPNVDAALAAGGQISGRLTAESGGGAIAGAEACAFESVHENSGGCATTNGNGEYTIQGAASGEYEVSFDAVGCSESGCTQQNYIRKTVKGVVVTAGSTTPNVNAALASGGQISGTVSGAEGGGGVEVCALEPTEGYVQCASTNASGAYTIPALISGEYEVQFSPLFTCGTIGCIPTNYLSQSYGSLVPVAAPNTHAGIDAAMSSAGKISGRITAETGGGAIAGGSACAYELTTKSYGACTTTNGNGEYVLQGFATGTYEVRFAAVGCGENGCTQQNYLERVITGVVVTAGSTTPNVNAALQAGGQIAGRVTDAATHAALANVFVCASGELGAKEFGYGCATTTGAARASGVARSNALSVPAPNSSFKLVGKPKFNAKTGNLVFTFQFPNAGHLGWSLFFKNSDVGFADSLGISLGEGGAVAETARKKHKKCKKGSKKHRGRCVRILVPFSSGSKNVPAGTVKVSVHASRKALEALKSGHPLHVSGTFTFHSSLGGAPASDKVSTVVRPSKKKKGKHGKHHRG